MIQEMDDIRL